MSLPSLLDAPPFLWQILDDYFQALLTTWKDQWVETAAATVVVAETFDPDAATMPAVVVMSYDKDSAGADHPFGDGQYHISGMSYDYQLVVCASFATSFLAKRFASAAAASLLDYVRADFENLCALNAMNGEFVQMPEFGNAELYVRGLAGQPIEGTYTGCVVLALTVLTEI